MSAIVIVGSGLAGYTLARELRKRDRTRPVVMVTADDGVFYSKPMLSNALSQGKTAAGLALGQPEKFAADMAVELRTHTELLAIDRAQQQVHLRSAAGEQRLAYGQLVLALGADPIRLPIAGDGAEAVLSVNNRADYQRFRQALGPRVVILGAGLIGCEFANDLVATGHQVDVLDVAPQVLGRLLPSGAAQFLGQALTAAGVRWHFGQGAQSVQRGDSGWRVTTSTGMALECDVVLSAVGLRPRVALAQAAGLSIQRGIVVDRLLRSSDPAIYALGDCAEVAGLNLPFVMPLMHGARALAATLSGTDTPVHYPAMPVVVKTPACATVVCPPPQGSQGEWSEHISQSGVRADYLDPQGQLLGFALLGDRTPERLSLGEQVPAWLG